MVGSLYLEVGLVEVSLLDANLDDLEEGLGGQFFAITG